MSNPKYWQYTMDQGTAIVSISPCSDADESLNIPHHHPALRRVNNPLAIVTD